MHRFKIAAALLAIGAPALAATALPAAAETTYHGPKCADIVDGTASYEDILTGVPSAHGRMFLGAAACKTVKYTLYVTDGTTTTTLLATATGTPGTFDGLPTVNFDTAVTDPTSDTGVCVYVTTSRGKHVFDRAPDTGCVAYTLNGGAAGLSYK